MIEAALTRDRLIVVAALALVTVLAWAWMLTRMDMPMASGGSMPTIADTIASAAAWSRPHAVWIFLMWWIMMVAMMLPSAAPFVLLAVALHHRKGGESRAVPMAGLLAAGYLAVWGAFSIVATLAQWRLESTGLLSATTMTTGPLVAAAILIAAGLYQLTPAKRACLWRCRSPAHFIADYWRPGAMGALRMGLAHGTFCIGCCWLLMGLLFAGGIMNPFWIGGIAFYILLEKLSPRGERLSQLAGVFLIIFGALAFSRAF